MATQHVLELFRWLGIVGTVVFYIVGVYLAHYELRLRHNGYEYYLDETTGKVHREWPLECDSESMRWAPCILTWLIWLPYRLYRRSHPIHPPTAKTLRRR